MSEQKHGIGRFDYSKVNYTTNDKKVELTCKKCNENFEVISRAHLHGNNCLKCGDIKKGLNRVKNRGKTINQDIINIHIDMIRLDRFEFKGMKLKSDFGCNVNEKHGYWEATPDNIIRGRGCPLCKTSKGEIKILNLLNENNILHIRQKTFDGCKLNQVLHFDFYLLNYNLCIEYDGQQHFESVEFFGGEEGFLKTQERDRVKNKFCKEKGINLLRIPYTQFDKIENLISNFIKQKMAG